MVFRGNESSSICRNQTNLKSFLRNELCASPITFFGTNPKREQHENVLKFCNPILQQLQLYITTRRLNTTSSSLLLMVCLPVPADAKIRFRIRVKTFFNFRVVLNFCEWSSCRMLWCFNSDGTRPSFKRKRLQEFKPAESSLHLSFILKYTY